MTYKQTIEYLYSLLPVFHRIGAKAFKADLSNTIKLCEYLGNPQNKFKSIHIAGTNGKGSTSHYIAAILQSAGYKTGLYTSPHLKDYTERFRINGKSIQKANIIAFVKKHKSIIEELKPSFFELSVAIAFDYFAKQGVDIAVIEVGLGGRLDSTNVITPELSVITNIGFDHTDILGDTLSKIAFEKAGIIKPNVPVVVSERHIETDTVFKDKAKECKSPIFFAEDNFQISEKGENNLKLIVEAINNNSDRKIFESQLIGKYQLKNLAGVLQAVEILKTLNYDISDYAIHKGISEVVTLTGLKGRWQILSQQPLTICDTAHNEHGLSIVLKQISRLEVKRKYFILGFVKDKNVEEILKLFPKDAEYVFCEADTPRSMSTENLIEIAQLNNISGYSILNVNDALKKVNKLASKDDLIYIGGSTFVVAGLNKL
ncbi:bifunctional folylpolyglutamate synthase/dihydrofolate synthase [Emticicia sp. SJ17W-69]|uniref:bifunctional folylpolyglutamate synthase/dihydrofolate synthase n=1 Tax=Emticicia sp. SJ17W-69 TaxID=3421657 RepID=UPI003EC04EC2